MFEIFIGNSLNPSFLILLGLILFIGEVMIVGTFVLFWAALSFVLVGIYSFWDPISWQMQLVAVSVLGSVFTWLLNPYLKKGKHPHEVEAFEPKSAEYGQLHLNKDGSYSVFYKGTYWLMDPNFPIAEVQTGQRVQVFGVKGNQVILISDKETVVNHD